MAGESNRWLIIAALVVSVAALAVVGLAAWQGSIPAPFAVVLTVPVVLLGRWAWKGWNG
jgi:hypothetical protein